MDPALVLSFLAALFGVVALLAACSRSAPHECVIHGHRFVARYDRVFGPQGVPARMVGDLRAVLEGCKETRYVQDVCSKCGDVVQRRAKADAKRVA